ncbi:RarD protein [Thioclava sp. SK-1]|uniref:EamA family transporter RarD n=1 Tax=Thioclava sp. SK-1 TaxID=1889770 RepID=UPI00082543BC|nr:EamA family transporter RarD [Thioclava sp. SK-1]OCX66488.1 RarD protein [Thioclava sp. SK-1]
MTNQSKGLIAIFTACTIWGLSGLFFAQLDGVPVLEVLAHRTLWSAAFFCVILALQGKLRVLTTLLLSRQMLTIAAATTCITLNWFTYIWSIHNHHALEASFGYYIFPLVSVMLGMVFLGEKMRRRQAIAVCLAALAVVYLGYSLGRPPWIPLILACSFGLYGLIKKRLNAEAIVTVTAEVILLVPFSLAYILGLEFGWFGLPAGSGLFGTGAKVSILLLASAGMTAVPLMLFSFAAQRLRLGTVGLVQYLNPSLQLCVALFVFAEPMTPGHMVALPIIWAALALYSWPARAQRISVA